jgi:hypothetical protein
MSSNVAITRALGAPRPLALNTCDRPPTPHQAVNKPPAIKSPDLYTFAPSLALLRPASERCRDATARRVPCCRCQSRYRGFGLKPPSAVFASPFVFFFLGDSSAKVWSSVRVGYVPELGQADARAQVPAATVACGGAWRADHHVYWRALAGVFDVLDNVLGFCWKLQGMSSLHACQIDVSWFVKCKEQNVSLGLI